MSDYARQRIRSIHFAIIGLVILRILVWEYTLRQRITQSKQSYAQHTQRTSHPNTTTLLLDKPPTDQITISKLQTQNKTKFQNQEHQAESSTIEVVYPLHFIPFCNSRYQRMRIEWISTTPRKEFKSRVLLIMGLLDLPGFDGSGEFTGDIMQWCDVAASLAILGAKVEVYGGTHRQRFLPSVLEPGMDLAQFTVIFSDYIGLNLFKRMYARAAREDELYGVACRFRIMDIFGTERSFIQKTNRIPNHWVPAGIDLIEQQILTFEPHHIQPGPFHQNNTFLGFAVPRTQHRKRQSEWKGLLWGKRPNYFVNVMPALRLLCEHIPLSTTTYGLDLPRQCIKSVGRMEPGRYVEFVQNHAVFIGAGEPAMGPGAPEAVAMGLLFMNPTNNPLWTVDFGSATTKPEPLLHGKPTRTMLKYQSNLLGDDKSKMAQIYVHNVDMHNLSDVRRVIVNIKNIYDKMSSNLTGYVTPQATVAAFTNRMETILGQDFCPVSWDKLETGNDNVYTIDPEQLLETLPNIWYAVVVSTVTNNKNNDLRMQNVKKIQELWPEVEIFNGSYYIDASCLRVLTDFNITVSDKYFSDEKGIGWVHTGKIGLWCSFLRFVLSCQHKETHACVWFENDLVITYEMKNAIIAKTKEAVISHDNRPILHIGANNEVVIISRRYIFKILQKFSNHVIHMPLDRTLWSSALSRTERLWTTHYKTKPTRLFTNSNESSIVCTKCQLVKSTDVNDAIRGFRHYRRNNSIYVVTLQGVENAHNTNANRLDWFRKAWNSTCGTMPTVHICPGRLHSVRGRGVTAAYVACFDRALGAGHEHPMFFEDDARLVNDRLCSGGEWDQLPHDTFLVLMGGHNWKYGSINSSGFQEVLHSFGMYGFMVPRQNLKHLSREFQRELQSTTTALSPDVSLFEHAKIVQKRVYALKPLLVEHIAGYSNTWHKKRETIFANTTI